MWDQGKASGTGTLADFDHARREARQRLEGATGDEERAS